METRTHHACAVLAIASIVGLAEPVMAQETEVAPGRSGATAPATTRSGSLDEVVVTARRRDERAFDVPVAVSVLTNTQLQNTGVINLSGLSRQIPSLTIRESSVMFGGALILRGVSSAGSTASIEQAVTINVDEIPIGYAGIVRLGQFDVSQVEVLKGPQALFFGKNSSGGIVSIRSAEPTKTPDAMVRIGYEPEAREWQGEAMISGPITPNVEGRLAVRVQDMDGWLRNIVPANSPSLNLGPFTYAPQFPKHTRFPATTEYMVRGALNIAPSDALSIKLKGSYGRTRIEQTLAGAQRRYCPRGFPQPIFIGQDCTLDDRGNQGYLDPAFHALDPRFPLDGLPLTHIQQLLLSGNVSYAFTDGLTLTSITGFYRLSQDATDQIAFGPVPLLAFTGENSKRTISQEVRLASSGAGAFNWMIGAFYAKDRYAENEVVVLPGAPIVKYVITPNHTFVIHDETISPFVQASYEILPSLTLSGGVRYTHEVKKQNIPEFPNGRYVRKISFDNWSPEVTLAYRPTEKWNIYGAYKEGFKAGGFQTEHISIPSALAAGNVFIDNSFREERVNGFEAGVKTRQLDGRLAINLVAYHYRYTGLQLGRFDPVLVTTILDNVGSSTTKGVDVDFRYAAVRGLNLSGAVSYNMAEFNSYRPTCYTAQTAAEGCVNGTFDASGRQLPNAPTWSGNLGAEYEFKVSSSLDMRLNALASYTGESEALTELLPNSRQSDYVLLDAGVALTASDGRWEFALIGRNLTNRFYMGGGGGVPLTGNAALGVRSDVFSGSTNRGRELRLRMTFRPFAR